MTADSSTSPDDTPAAPDQPAAALPPLSPDLPPNTEEGILPLHPDEGEIVAGSILLIPDTYAAEPEGATGLKYPTLPDNDAPLEPSSDYAAMPDIDEPFDFPSDVKNELNGR